MPACSYQVSECSHPPSLSLSLSLFPLLIILSSFPGLLPQKLPLHIGNDNIFVSSENGHLWVAHFDNIFQLLKYIHNHSEPMPGKIMHIAIDQSSDLPFTNCKIEEVLSTSGEKINAMTTGLYHRGKLLVGTIRKDMWMCEVPYLMY